MTDFSYCPSCNAKASVMTDGTVRYSHDYYGGANHNPTGKPCEVGQLTCRPDVPKNRKQCNKCNTTVTYSHSSKSDSWYAIYECPICWAMVKAMNS